MDIKKRSDLGGMTVLEFMNSSEPVHKIKDLSEKTEIKPTKGAREAATEYEEWLREQGRIK